MRDEREGKMKGLWGEKMNQLLEQMKDVLARPNTYSRELFICSLKTRNSPYNGSVKSTPH